MGAPSSSSGRGRSQAQASCLLDRLMSAACGAVGQQQGSLEGSTVPAAGKTGGGLQLSLFVRLLLVKVRDAFVMAVGVCRCELAAE